jgi:hypothetical protein
MVNMTKDNKKQPEKKVEKPKLFVNPTVTSFGKISKQGANNYAQGMKMKKNKIFRGVQ